jgi:hypothetical protein
MMDGINREQAESEQMQCLQAATEKAQDMLYKGELADAAAANVEIVRMMGVRIFRKVPSDLRKALNAAVKEGRLGHLKKNGLLPEAYFHPNSKNNAIGMRQREAREAAQSIMKTCVPHSRFD